MTAEAFVGNLRRAGVSIVLDADGQLRVRPAARVNLAARAFLETHRGEIERVLSFEARPSAAKPAPASRDGAPGDAREPARPSEPADAVVGPARAEASAAPALLPREKWAAVRLREVRGPNGDVVVTHPAGDAYAQQVLTGAIPYDVAVRRERDADRESYARSPERETREARAADLLGMSKLRKAR